MAEYVRSKKQTSKSVGKPSPQSTSGKAKGPSLAGALFTREGVMNNNYSIGRRGSSSNFKRLLLLALFLGGIPLAWYNRASWMPKEMPSIFSGSPSVQLMKSGGQVCVYGVKDAIVAGARAGEDGCVKGIDVAPGRPILIMAGGKQTTLTFKEWGETQPLPGFTPQTSSSPASNGGITTASGAPTPHPPPDSATTTTTTSGGASTTSSGGGGSTWTAITEGLGKVFSSGSKVEAPSWATAQCPAGQKTIWIAEDGTVTSDVDGYTVGNKSYRWQKSEASDLVIAVKDGTGKFHVGTRIAPGVWCTQ